MKRLRNIAPTKAVLALALSLFCLSAAACRVTPEYAAVVGKREVAQALLAERTDRLPLAEHLGAPAHYENQISAPNGGVLSFDAAVRLPETDQLPVAAASVSRFTEKQAASVADAFFGKDAEYFAPSGPSRAFYQRRVEVLEEEIIAIRQEIVNFSESYEIGSIDASTGEQGSQTIDKQYLERHLAAYEKKYAQAQADLLHAKDTPLQPGALTYTDYSSIFDSYDIPCIAAISERNGTRFMVRTAYDGLLLTIGVEDILMAGFSQPTSYFPTGAEQPENVALEKKEAEEAASQLVQQMDDAFRLQETCVASTDDGRGGGMQAWQCIFTRSIADVPAWFSLNEINPSTEAAVKMPVYYERITVSVDDSGIVGVEWLSPTSIDAIRNRNAALLPFEGIMEIVECKLGDLPNDDNSLCVTSMELGMARIDKENAPMEFYMIPVWDFYGKWNEQEHADRYSYLTINAIDGSIIDRTLGY